MIVRDESRIEPYCEGKDCPLSSSCLRHIAYIIKTQEYHFAWSPYQPHRKLCEHYKEDLNALVERLYNEG
jgi:hypothetical protein